MGAPDDKPPDPPPGRGALYGDPAAADVAPSSVLVKKAPPRFAGSLHPLLSLYVPLVQAPFGLIATASTGQTMTSVASATSSRPLDADDATQVELPSTDVEKSAHSESEEEVKWDADGVRLVDGVPLVGLRGDDDPLS